MIRFINTDYKMPTLKLCWLRILIGLIIPFSLFVSCNPNGLDIDEIDESGVVTVFAASSLTEAFSSIGESFMSEYNGVEVIFNFAGTATLNAQLEQGAKADVFASASPKQMQRAVDTGLVVGDNIVFASNSLVLIISKDHANISRLEDLDKEGVKLVIAHAGVPVGDYFMQSLADMNSSGAFGPEFFDRVIANVVSEETNVRQVVAKVAMGEADAGIVYKTDVTEHIKQEVHMVEIPYDYLPEINYPVSKVSMSTNVYGGNTFISYILSKEGQQILKSHGFEGID